MGVCNVYMPITTATCLYEKYFTCPEVHFAVLK